jgi:hypothetical protein
MYVASLALWLSDDCGEGASLGIRIFALTLQAVLISLIFTWHRNPSILINIRNNTIVYYSGRRTFKIKPCHLKTVKLSGGILEITAKNGKNIRISPGDFPTIDLQSLANYIKTLTSNGGPIEDGFFDNENSGFHVTTKTVMESPNPWPHVLFIFFILFAVVMVIYFIIETFA